MISFSDNNGVSLVNYIMKQFDLINLAEEFVYNCMLEMATGISTL